MKRDNAVFLVQSRFGGMDGEEERIIAEMQLSQEVYERSVKRPWFLVKTQERDVTIEGYTNLTNDFLLEYEPGAVWLRNSQAIKLIKKQSFDIAAGISGIGPPQYYDIIGNVLYVFPLPDATYRILIRYYGRDTVLDTNIENKFLRHAPDLLVAHTCMEIAKFVEPELIPVFVQDVQAAQQRLGVENEARMIANMDIYLGEDF